LQDFAAMMCCGNGGVGGILRDLELIHDRDNMACAILCRQGGDISTSIEEARHPRCGSSAAPLHQVVRPRWIGDDLRRRIFAEREPASTLLSFLGGNAWRTPTSNGGDTQGLDCFNFICLRVFFYKDKGLIFKY
jgi:hypothetical protein